MAILGLMTRSEHAAALEAQSAKFNAEIEALKATFMPWERWQLETAGAEKYNPPDLGKFENQANLYRRLSSVFTAVDIVSSAAALTPFSVKRVIKGREPKDIPGHEFEMLLENPNPLDSRYDFLYATVAFWKLNRNSYWWLNRADEFAKPEEIWFIPPHMILPVPDSRMFLKGYLYYPGNGASIFLPVHEIVHFKGFNPFSRFIGLSAAIESLMLLAESYLGMMTWQAKVYKQSNGRLPSLMTFEQMVSDPQWDKIKSDTREAAQNRDIMLLRGVGQGGVQWIQNTSSQKDMDFFTGLDAIDKKIMDTLAPGAYTMLYENANEANSRTGRATLNELSIYPVHVMMAQRITNAVLPAYGSDLARPLIGRFEDIRVTDRQLEIAEMQEYSKTHTVAEVREKYYGDDPLGDERDDLFPDQVDKERTTIAQEDLPAPTAPGQSPASPGEGSQGNQPMLEMQSAANNPPGQEDQPAAKLLENLEKYERFALRKFKDKRLSDKFTNPALDEGTIDQIHRRLQLCESETAVKAVFETARKRIPADPIKQEDTGALVTLAKSLDNMAAAMRAQEQTAFTLEAIKAMISGNGHQPSINLSPIIQIPPGENNNMDAAMRAQEQTAFIQEAIKAMISGNGHQPSINLSPIIQVPPGENNLYIQPPEQTAPTIYNTFPLSVEAAKAPNIQVDSPVYVNQTIEPGKVPGFSVPVKIENFFEQPAPPPITITAQLPEQGAPSVVFSPVIQPSDVAVNVTNEVQPTPVEITNENNVTIQPADVNLPDKGKETKQVTIDIKRDAAGRIQSAEGKIEEE